MVKLRGARRSLLAAAAALASVALLAPSAFGNASLGGVGEGPVLYGTSDYRHWVDPVGNRYCAQETTSLRDGYFYVYCLEYVTPLHYTTMMTEVPNVVLTSIFAGDPGLNERVGDDPSWAMEPNWTSSTFPPGRYNASVYQTCSILHEYYDYIERRPNLSTGWTTSYRNRGSFTSDCSGGESRQITAYAAPTFDSGSASGVTGTAARLNAVFISHGLDTKYYVEWGEDSSYGHYTDVNGVDLTATSNVRPESISADLSGLVPGRTYHWRIHVSSAAGVLISPDQSFTTSAPADTAPPAISLNGASGIVNTATPTLTFTTGEPATFTCAIDAGEFGDCGSELATSGSFTPPPLSEGPHTLRVKATDALGNETTTPSESPIVVDVSNPTLTLSHTTDRGGWNTSSPVPITVSAADSATPPTPTTCTDGDAPISGGSVSGDGVHNVSCTVSDLAGHSVTATDTIRIDTIAPELTVTHTADTIDGWNTSGPVALDLAATDDGSGVSTDVATCTDNGDPFEGTSVSGDGVHAINCSVSDAAGNATTASDTVSIDSTAPVVTVPEDVTTEATGPDGATVDYIDAAGDGGEVASCAPASGGLFPIGETTVTCTATDAHGNEGTATFTATVADTAAPTVAVADQTVEATGPDGAAVDLDASADDLVDGASTPDCEPASDSTFALGDTNVTCTATDAAGNRGSDTARVTVRDTTAPAFTAPPDVVAEATTADGAKVDYTAPGTSDAVDANGTAACLPASGSTFALGGTDVSCTTSDAAGNARTETFKVTVRDTTAPSVTVTDCPVAVRTGSVASIHWTASDAVSGLAGAASGTTVLPTGTPGRKSITAGADDQVGNHGSAVCDYVVNTVPTRPGKPSAPAFNRGAFTLTWTPPVASDPGAVLTYTVQRRAAVAGSSWYQIADRLSVTTLAFAADDPQSEGRWIYRVLVSDGYVQSAPSLDSSPFQVDRTAPAAPVLSVAPGQTPVVVGRQDWYRDRVSIAVAAADEPGGSGLKSFASPFALKTDGVKLISKTVTDKAGNVSPPGTLTVAVDALAPKLTVTCPAGTIARGAKKVLARWSAKDASSGVAGPAFGSDTLDTSVAGIHEYSRTVSDLVGHAATRTCPYTVG